MAGVNQVFSFADDVVRYLKACGKSSILQTKPVNPSQLKGLKLATKLESDVVKFSTKEIKLDDELFNILPWRKGDNRLPVLQTPPQYTSEAKRVTKLFEQKHRVDEPLPNGFRFCASPRTKVDENGNILERMQRLYSLQGGKGQEYLFLDETSGGVEKMLKQINNIIDNNPNLTTKEKAELLKKFVSSCYDKTLSGKYHQSLPSGFINITHTAASGIGVCRHKTFLTKILADKLGLKVSMVRGQFTPKNSIIAEEHMWNEIKIGNEMYLLDVEQNIFENLSKDLDIFSQYRYY